MDFSLTTCQIVFQSPQYTFIMWWLFFLDLFQVHDTMTYWFSIQYKSPDDDLDISIFTWYNFFFNFEFYRKFCIWCQEVVENTSMEWYKNWNYGMIVQETILHPITDIFKILQVEEKIWKSIQAKWILNKIGQFKIVSLWNTSVLCAAFINVVNFHNM